MSLILAAAASAATPERPRLQIIKGSDQTADIYWLKSDTERVPSGSVAPGKWTLITTTLGHRFEVVGREKPPPGGGPPADRRGLRRRGCGSLRRNR